MQKPQASLFRIRIEDDAPDMAAVTPVGARTAARVKARRTARRAFESSAVISWQFPGEDVERLRLGPFPPKLPPRLGLIGERFTEHHVAFLLLVIKEQAHHPRSPSQAVRIRERLGQTEWAFEQWLKRNLNAHPGDLLRWDEMRNYRHVARASGPWWIVADDIRVEDEDRATQYVDHVARKIAMREGDVGECVGRARKLCAEDQWVTAQLLLDGAIDRYFGSEQKRADPVWYGLLLARARIEMQIGRPQLSSAVVTDIFRSLKQSGLGQPEADLTRARAHYIAVCVADQLETAAADEDRLTRLDHAIELLRNIRSEAGERELVRARALREEVLAGGRSVLPAASESMILKAAGSEGSAHGKHVVYGDALRKTGQYGRALDHLLAALEQKEMETRFRSAALRAAALARWHLDRDITAAVDTLDRALQVAMQAGFQHQAKIIRRARNHVQGWRERGYASNRF